MTVEEMFDSCVREDGDLAGVFEYDGETGHFYLYATQENYEKKVLGAIHIISQEPDFTEADISVRWDLKEEHVGLFIRGQLWAAYDGNRRIKYGGNYTAGSRSLIPLEVISGFGDDAR